MQLEWEQRDTHTDTQDNYSSSHACVPRVNNMPTNTCAHTHTHTQFYTLRSLSCLKHAIEHVFDVVSVFVAGFHLWLQVAN